MFECIDERLLGIQVIPGDHQFEFGMGNAQFFNQPFGRIDFTILFLGAVGVFNGFRRHGDDFTDARTYDDRL